MRALLLAAGLGTRLRPLTDNKPKPLVEIAGRPMISYVLDWLERSGFSEILVNVHYFPEQIRDFLKIEQTKRSHLKFEIQDESAKILGSGGAVKKAAPWLFAKDSTALVLNADSLMNPDFSAMLKHHQKMVSSLGAECTITLMEHADAGRKYNAFSLSKSGLVEEWVKAEAGRQGEFFHFPGNYLIEKNALLKIAPSLDDFNIVDKCWIPLIGDKKLSGWIYDGAYYDLGTPADLKVAEAALLAGAFKNQFTKK